MKFIRLAIATVLLMMAADAAAAADWTTTEAGSVVCSKVKPVGICWLKDIAEDSSVISVRECGSITIMVYGTGVSIMPQSCDDSSCTKAENLLAAVLDGDSPDTFMTSTAPMEFIRIDWTNSGSAPTISLKCGK